MFILVVSASITVWNLKKTMEQSIENKSRKLGSVETLNKK